jgi:hypothetical protein
MATPTPVPDEPAFTEIDVQAYRQAFEEEFEAKQAATRKPINDLEELREPSLNAVSYTLNHSANESLRTRTAQWVLDKLLENATREEDKVLDFLKGMPTATTPTPTPTSADT